MASFRVRVDSRGRKRHQAQVTIKGHPIVRKTFGKKSDAVSWADRVEAHVKIHGRLPESELSRHTLGEAIEAYERDRLPSLKASTQGSTSVYLAEWQGRLGVYSVAAITPTLIRDHYREIAQRSSGPTANRSLSVLSVVFDHARKELRWIDSNPCRDVSRSPDSPVRVRFLTDDERKRLLAACREARDPRLYPLVLLALTTGARRGELLGLKWQDLDLKRGRAVLHDTKTRRRESLTIHGEALDILKRAAKTPHISGYVFSSIDGKPSFPRGPWEDAFKTAGVENFRFHDLRHTFANHLLRAGATLAEVKSALRHSTFAAVQRYAHLAEDHAEGRIRAMVDDLLG